ncbi:hypothetical protein B0I35DRAFT_444835 [Stachybotrys elegans]|uniref:Ubiquitin 3 binding protein But2 C-terminal domain-containing protein n=1 Tax=Stachybotrys elegans TaxID=80388 RepID=A0A8K0WKJ8_9HYPO|nr:hypothetical protein B0I35DRAFT_444835 [Stachybotrys elegans]
MHLHHAIIVTIASSSVLGAPLEARSDSYFTPSVTWRYNVGTGAISGTSTGLIAKSNTNGGQDTTALVTFVYPAGVAGKRCQFAFYLNDGAALAGSRKIDLFTVNDPAPGPRAGWGPGNQRDIQLGRLSAVKPGLATWDATYSSYLTQSTECKPPGTTEAFELAGVYDKDFISWDLAVAGPRIFYSY